MIRLALGVSPIRSSAFTVASSSLGPGTLASSSRCFSTRNAAATTLLAAGEAASAVSGGGAVATAAGAAGKSSSSSFLGRALKISLGALVSTAVVGGVAGRMYIKADPNLEERYLRTKRFWTGTLPVLLEYRWCIWKTRNACTEVKDREFNKLHDKYAKHIYDLILDMRGIYVKLGQVASTRKDMCPKQYLDLLTTLQDGVPPEDPAVIRAIIEENFGKKMEDIFLSFDDRCLGAASIGQVHAAKLLDGTDVVVKIQYPAASRLFGLDIANSKMFTEILQPEYSVMMEEVEKQFKTEFDFEREAWALQTVGTNLKEFPDIVVPRPVPGLVTKNVFVMERLHGEKLLDGVMARYRAYAERNGLSMDDLMKSAEEYRLKMKGYNKPSATTVAVYNALSTVGAVSWNALATAYNFSLGLVTAPMSYAEKPLANHVTLLDTVTAATAKQVLVDGVFNGDPHPGNILLLKDGKIGLIDYGQTKLITREQRLNLCHLIVALAEGDNEAVATQFIKMGFKTEKMNKFVIEKTATLFFDRDGVDVTGTRNLQMFMEHLQELDKTKNFPQEYVMASRVTFLLRGLGLLFMTPLSVAREWVDVARAVIKNEEGASTPKPDPSLPAHLKERYHGILNERSK